jgi:hypothetical protein
MDPVLIDTDGHDDAQFDIVSVPLSAATVTVTMPELAVLGDIAPTAPVVAAVSTDYVVFDAGSVVEAGAEDAVQSEASQASAARMSSAASLVAGDDMGRPITIGDAGDADVIKGDGFDGEIISIDDGWIDDGGYDGGTYDGGGTYDYSGQWSTSVGDINGDGFEDTLVATYGYDEAGNYSATSTIVLSGADQGTRLTVDGQDIYGWSVSAAGDVNGDGFDDVLVSTYDYDDYSASTYVVFGSAAGFGDELDLATLDGTNGFQLFSGNADEGFWYVTAVGDVDGDGFDDLAIEGYLLTANGDYSSASQTIFGAPGLGSTGQVILDLVATPEADPAEDEVSITDDEFNYYVADPQEILVSTDLLLGPH